MKTGIWTHESGDQWALERLPKIEVGADFTNEIWITPDSGGQDKGIGTHSRPFRVRTPDDFDVILSTSKRKTTTGGLPGTRFRLTSGQFLTRGAWAYAAQGYAMLRGADELVGDGSRRTALQVDSPILETDGKARPEAHILTVGSLYRSDTHSNRVSGLSLQSAHRLTTAGLRVYAPDVDVRDVRVTGAHGSGEPVAGPSGTIPYEGFGISFGGNGSGEVQDCIVTQRFANSYLSAFSGGTGRVVFRNCYALGMWDAPGYAAFTIYRDTIVENCRCKGFKYAVYNDTADMIGSEVTDCRFEVSYSGVSLVAKPQTVKRELRVTDCQFRYVPEPGQTAPCIGLQMVGKQATFRAIEVRGCRFITQSKGQAFYLLSSDATDAEFVEIFDPVCPDGAIVSAPYHDATIAAARDWSGRSGKMEVQTAEEVVRA